MNLKLASVVLALCSLPLAGCGNKGPLVLPPNPPAEEAEALPVVPPLDDATVPVDAVPAAAPPADDGGGDESPPPAPSDDGNG